MDPLIKARLDEFISGVADRGVARLELLEGAVRRWREHDDTEAAVANMAQWVLGYINFEKKQDEELPVEFRAEMGVHPADHGS